jgi:nucleoid-associated protein Lsr2
VAKKTVVEWIDDLDGSSASETVTFTIDGSRYEIDLSEKNAAKLRGVMSGWIEASRRSGHRRTRGGTAKPDPSESSNARKWAIDNGFDVGPRGRLRSEVLDAYRSRTVEK